MREMVPSIGVCLLVLTYICAIKTLGADNQITRSAIHRQLRPVEQHNDDGEEEMITGLKTYIVNGNDASPNRYPYQVIMVRESGESYCGGTLIAPDIILTAAHCEIPAWVVVGSHDRNDNDDDFELHHVMFSYRHPRYLKDTFQFDMKLLKLRNPSHKLPIRLNGNPNLPSLIQGTDQNLVTVMGFGKTLDHGLENTLQEADLSTISNKDCELAKDPSSKQIDLQNGYKGKITDNMLCLSDIENGGKDACTGDSGGPAILKGNKAEEDVQVGIISWAFGCALKNFPGVYSRISHESLWLASSVCSMSDQPLNNFDCDRFFGGQTMNDERGPTVEINVTIRFALYPDRISWAFTDATTLETLNYQPSSEFTSLSSGSYFQQVISLPAGSNITYTIWSIGSNGLESFSATYKGYDGNEIKILSGRGGGDADEDSATSAPHVLPSFPMNQPTRAPEKEFIAVDPIVTNAPHDAAKGKLPTGTQSPDPTPVVTYEPTEKPTKLPTETPTSSQTSKPFAMPNEAPTTKPVGSPITSSSKTPTHDPTLVTFENPSEAPATTTTGSRTKAPAEILSRDPTLRPSKNLRRIPIENPDKLPAGAFNLSENQTDEPSLVQPINPTESNSPTSTPVSVAALDQVSTSLSPLSSFPSPLISDSPSIPSISSIVPTMSLLAENTSTSSKDKTKLNLSETTSNSGSASPETPDFPSISEVGSTSTTSCAPPVQDAPFYGRLLLVITLSWTIVMMTTTNVIFT